MRPTLEAGDRWLVDPTVANLKRGDIIYFKFPKDQTKYYVKRVVALPNEKVEIRDGTIYINGEALQEDYVDPIYNESVHWMPEKLVPADEFFVLGDNRDNSSDSRYWGTVNRSLIVGTLSTRYNFR